MRDILARLDSRIYQVERALVGALFVVMGVVVFCDVIHRVFSRVPGRVAVLLSGILGTFSVAASPEALDAKVAPGIIITTLLVLTYAALRTRSVEKPRRVTTIMTVGFVGGATFIVQGYLYLMPDGIVWAPYLALCILLWLGLLGASMATFSGRHLALEMGEKLWPKAMQPAVKVGAQLVTAGFCVLFLVLGTISMLDHYDAWTTSPRAALIPSVELPKWAVFSVVPYAFAMMAWRFLGSAVGLLPSPPRRTEP